MRAAAAAADRITFAVFSIRLHILFARGWQLWLLAAASSHGAAASFRCSPRSRPLASRRAVTVGKSEDQEYHDSWSKTFEPELAVRQIMPTNPPFTWDAYIAEDGLKSKLKCIYEAAVPSGDGLVSRKDKMLTAIRSLTRGTSSLPPSTAHRMILLHGPPGNGTQTQEFPIVVCASCLTPFEFPFDAGKTHAIQVIACESANSGISVYRVDFTPLKSTWHAQTEHQFKSVLKYIGQLKNAIVFIDQVDSFVGQFNRRNEYYAPLLIELLQWINGLDTDATQNLTLICATNCMDTCDPAFLSRCSLKIEILPPSKELRVDWWSKKARHLSEFEINSLAEIGAPSFCELEQVINDAEENAAAVSYTVPTFADYYERMQSLRQKEERRPQSTDLHSIEELDHRLIDHVKSVAASTAAMTVASMKNSCVQHGLTVAPVDVVSTNDDSEESDDAESETRGQLLRDELSLLRSRLSKLENPEPGSTIVADEAFVEKTNAALAKASLSFELFNTALDDSNALTESLRKENKEIWRIETDTERKIETLQRSQQEATEIIESLSAELKELRDWESVRVTWEIESFESRLSDRFTRLESQCIHVAGYSMCLQLQVNAQDAGDRNVSIYIMHKGGLEFLPIQIGGSALCICGKDRYSDWKRTYGQDEEIDESRSGRGWTDMMSLQDFRTKHISNGDVEVRATIRVRRLAHVSLRCNATTGFSKVPERSDDNSEKGETPVV